jgi:hypothetical protein
MMERVKTQGMAVIPNKPDSVIPYQRSLIDGNGLVIDQPKSIICFDYSRR